MGTINNDIRKMRFEQVERMLNSDVTVAEWCRLNKVPRSTMYHWLRIFRDTNGADGKQNGWIELDRKEIKAAKALVPTNTLATISSDALRKDPDASQSCARPIRLRANGVEIDVFANTAQADIKAVLEAVVSL